MLTLYCQEFSTHALICDEYTLFPIFRDALDPPPDIIDGLYYDRKEWPDNPIKIRAHVHPLLVAFDALPKLNAHQELRKYTSLNEIVQCDKLREVGRKLSKLGLCFEGDTEDKRRGAYVPNWCWS